MSSNKKKKHYNIINKVYSSFNKYLDKIQIKVKDV